MPRQEPGPTEEVVRPATMQDVAIHAGVSRQLVSMVLRGLDGPSDESRARVVAAARSLRYRPNSSARLLRQRRSRLIGLLFTMRNPFQVRVAEGLFARAAVDGFGLVLGPITEERPGRVVAGELLEARVEGILAFNLHPEQLAIDDAHGSSVPLVLLGEWSDQGGDSVHVDEAAGLRLAIEHLSGLGHRSITFLGGQEGRVGRHRAAAYRSGMAAAGLGSHEDIIESDFTEEGGARAARRFLELPVRPTAVICGSDRCAEGFLAVLVRAGIAVPRDVSVVGFDDSYVAALSYLQLTSIRQDVEATVEGAWKTVMSRLEGADPSGTVVATSASLTVRSSTAPLSCSY